MRGTQATTLVINTSLLKPGMRLGVGVSGGADSVALLRALHGRRAELGLALHVAHLHHGLRGAEADADLEFVRELAAGLDLPFHVARVETAREAEENGESIEEGARRLRYAWFRELMSKSPSSEESGHAAPLLSKDSAHARSLELKGLAHAVGLDAIATAHTRDDQAETVLGKFLRGAWTEGLAGIAPKLEWPEGLIVRPMLGATRGEVEGYLKTLGQAWREDSSNRDEKFTRNRIRHELLPLLEGWNPRLREHMTQMAEVAREEEAWWEIELGRVAPQMLMEGKPVRGGGRAAGNGLAIDGPRFAALGTAFQRRLLRHAAEKLGVSLDFAGTEALRMLAVAGRAGQRRELTNGLRGERTPRELRLTVEAAGGEGVCGRAAVPEYIGTIPGEIAGPAFGFGKARLCLASHGRAGLIEAGLFRRLEAGRRKACLGLFVRSKAGEALACHGLARHGSIRRGGSGQSRHGKARRGVSR